MSTREKLVRARKPHTCEEYGQPHLIQPGQDYVRLVAFPDGDINTSNEPWVMRLCVPHYEQHGRTAPDRGTPPRKHDPKAVRS